MLKPRIFVFVNFWGWSNLRLQVLNFSWNYKLGAISTTISTFLLQFLPRGENPCDNPSRVPRAPVCSYCSPRLNAAPPVGCTPQAGWGGWGWCGWGWGWPEKSKAWKEKVLENFYLSSFRSATVPSPSSCPQPGAFKYPIPIISCKIGDVTEFL